VTIPPSPVFAGLTERDRRVVLAAAEPRVLKPRAVLAREGDAATTFSVVQLGHLKLTKVSEDGHEMIVRFVGPGEPFAGVVAAGQATYPVSAIAIEPTRTLDWTRDVLLTLVTEFPRLKANIVDQITQHMTDALTRVQELTTDRVEVRLARALIRLAAHGGLQTPVGVEIAHPVTRQELADLISATLFTVSRLLARWEQQGLVATERRHIVIAKPEGLAVLARTSPRRRRPEH